MELRVAEVKASSPKREIRSLRARNHRSLRNNLLESIAQANGGSVVSQVNEDGVVRMKLLVRKQDLRQMLEVMRGHGKNISQQQSFSTSSSLTVEQRLNLLRKKQLLRASAAAKESRRHSWTPQLQSIPEEF
ncbi:hypothetical protein MANES_04G070400v8 [Manihot esculenta]|uniref:Uncharacterized protein n=1 Tax=Manihot esculenta TaxID=3983 RepID=A0A2C9W077_MANES|nr:hypothetical protein MANES_04G070400v8 [Manihot esculenta]